jgi:hypothetical protein
MVFRAALIVWGGSNLLGKEQFLPLTFVMAPNAAKMWKLIQ